jgi:hypothetical protein
MNRKDFPPAVARFLDELRALASRPRAPKECTVTTCFSATFDIRPGNCVRMGDGVMATVVSVDSSDTLTLRYSWWQRVWMWFVSWKWEVRTLWWRLKGWLRDRT